MQLFFLFVCSVCRFRHWCCLISLSFFDIVSVFNHVLILLSSAMRATIAHEKDEFVVCTRVRLCLVFRLGVQLRVTENRASWMGLWVSSGNVFFYHAGKSYRRSNIAFTYQHFAYEWKKNICLPLCNRSVAIITQISGSWLLCASQPSYQSNINN